jgi:hypothetical protein
MMTDLVPAELDTQRGAATSAVANAAQLAGRLTHAPCPVTG